MGAEEKETCKGQVKLFEHKNFKGWEAGFPKGEYPLSAFKAMGAKNDGTSSIKVPAGCVAKLYQHGSFTGWKATFPPGSYTMKQMVARGAKNDDSSSIVVENK